MISALIIGVVLLAALILQIRPLKSGVRNLSALLPVYKVENGCIVSKTGDVTVAISLQLPEIFTLSTDEYEALHHTWLRALKLLPPGTVIHKQDWFTEDKFQAELDKEGQSVLSKSSEMFFHERSILEHESFVMITRKANNRKLSTSVFSNLIRPTLVPQENITPQQMQDFLDKVGQFENLLGDSGFIKTKRLTDDEIAGTEGQAGLIERYCFLLSSNDMPVIKDAIFKPEWKIGENYLQMFSFGDVENLPSLCGPRLTYDKYSTDKSKFPVGFASSIGQLLNCNHVYNQFIVIEDVPKTLKKLESKRRRLQSLAAYSRENALSKEATNDFLNEAISQQRQPVKAHFNLMVWTDKSDRLKDLRNMASAAIAQMDANPHLEVNGAPQLYWAGLPGNAADLPVNECFDTFCEQATCFLAQETSYKSSVSSFGIRVVDRQMGKPLWVDFSDLPMKLNQISNRSKAVFGSSGSGKSMFMCHLMRSYYEQGAHCVIVDVGGSYSGLCQLVKGYYFTYTEKNPIRFNPFYIPDGDSLDTEKKESIKTLILSLWKKDDEPFRRAEYVAISNALHLYFEHLEQRPTVFPCFDSFYEFVRDTYVKVLKDDNVKEKDFDIDNFLYVLRPYYSDGEFGYLLNAREKLDVFNQRFVVFELDNIKDHPVLLPVVSLMICEMFISKMRKIKGVRKVITIEEAWKAIAKAGMAEFIKYLYKTVRKFFGEAIVVTQELDDVISSPIIKEAILNNADCKILLDMRKFQNKFDQIQVTMGMPDKGKPMVLSLNKSNDPNRRYREFYVELGGAVMKVYGYEPSPFEYYAYTTEEREKVLVHKYTEMNGGDMYKGIRALLKDAS